MKEDMNNIAPPEIGCGRKLGEMLVGHIPVINEIRAVNALRYASQETRKDLIFLATMQTVLEITRLGFLYMHINAGQITPAILIYSNFSLISGLGRIFSNYKTINK